MQAAKCCCRLVAARIGLPRLLDHFARPRVARPEGQLEVAGRCCSLDVPRRSAVTGWHPGQSVVTDWRRGRWVPLAPVRGQNVRHEARLGIRSCLAACPMGCRRGPLPWGRPLPVSTQVQASGREPPGVLHIGALLACLLLPFPITAEVLTMGGLRISPRATAACPCPSLLFSPV